MPRMTSGYAKNIIRRSLWTILDPEPNKKSIEILWKFFKFACAYCGRQLSKNMREGHVDHLVPIALGGRNHISNRVLSCSNCNGNEKREEEWLKFLKKRAKTQKSFCGRKKRIYSWMKVHASQDKIKINLRLLRGATERVIAVFDGVVERLRREKRPFTARS